MNDTKYFRLSKGLAAVSTNTARCTAQQTMYDEVNGSIKYYTVKEII